MYNYIMTLTDVYIIMFSYYLVLSECFRD